MTKRTLYDFPLSGNCYKVRLMLSMLGLEYERIPVDIFTGESQEPKFKALSPRGQVPLLVDAGEAIWDSMAILVYLARSYGAGTWLPAEPLDEARVMQWLAVSENELLYGIARARAVRLWDRPFDYEQCLRDARSGLEAMEGQLSKTAWLTGGKATIADIACYPYVSLAQDGDIPLAPYASVRQWLARFETLPGWLPMTE